ncbi:unnamed protein product, partial [Symbiodinium pilosum]
VTSWHRRCTVVLSHLPSASLQCGLHLHSCERCSTSCRSPPTMKRLAGTALASGPGAAWIVQMTGVSVRIMSVESADKAFSMTCFTARTRNSGSLVCKESCGILNLGTM